MKKGFFPNKKYNNQKRESNNESKPQFMSSSDFDDFRVTRLIEILNEYGKPITLMTLINYHAQDLRFPATPSSRGKIRQFLMVLVKRNVITKKIIQGTSYIALQEDQTSEMEHPPDSGISENVPISIEATSDSLDTSATETEGTSPPSESAPAHPDIATESRTADLEENVFTNQATQRPAVTDSSTVRESPPRNGKGPTSRILQDKRTVGESRSGFMVDMSLLEQIALLERRIDLLDDEFIDMVQQKRDVKLKLEECDAAMMKMIV